MASLTRRSSGDVDFLLKLTLGAVEETLEQATKLGTRPEARLISSQGI